MLGGVKLWYYLCVWVVNNQDWSLYFVAGMSFQWLLGRYWDYKIFLWCKLGSYGPGRSFTYYLKVIGLSQKTESTEFTQAAIYCSSMLKRPKFQLYDQSKPIFTCPRFLPPTKMEKCEVKLLNLVHKTNFCDSDRA